jgi:hypothetical protein
MVTILAERGITFSTKKLAECKNFKCNPPRRDCCYRRILFNQPDFASVESNLETLGRSLGIPVLFLPKYHCELNFIEQCWGYAKRLYRLNPESSREDVLEKNTMDAINAVPLVAMHRYVLDLLYLLHSEMLIFNLSLQLCQPLPTDYGCIPEGARWKKSRMGHQEILRASYSPS